MKLQQLRYLSEVARRGLNVSEAAEALHTSQPGVSKQIRALEDELGIQVFARHGKRLVSITEPGKAVLAIAERILSEAQNLRRAGEEFANDQLGTLTIAATHTPARYAIVTYDFAFANRSLVEKAFENRGLHPNVVLTALDSDVIKTYVELGLGIGILAKMAFDPKRDINLRAIDASHLFESSTTRLGIKRNAYLRRYAYEFIELFAPHLARATVERAVRGEEGSRYEL